MTSVAEPLVSSTISGSGLSASTAYTVSVVDPQGHTTVLSATSDGSGAFTLKFVPQQVGAYTAEARPAVDYKGKTNAAASGNGRCK